MELRSLSSQNVLVKTDSAQLLIAHDSKQIKSLLKDNKDIQIVISFVETKGFKNREVLICDWPGEYERSDTSIIGLHDGCFVAAFEGKYWLIVEDTALKHIDHDNEYLNNVEGLLLWVSGKVKKEDIQDAIAQITPSYLVYCATAESEALLKELVPPPQTSVQSLTIKASEFDGSGEQIKAHALIV